MFLKTPAEMESVAWEGELVPPNVAMLAKSVQDRPVVPLASFS